MYKNESRKRLNDVTTPLDISLCQRRRDRVVNNYLVSYQ